MKPLTSNCEEKFIYGSICRGRRLDGRTPLQGRDVDVFFGKADGACIVMLGKTIVIASVTGEITSPNPSRPSEGSLHINLDVSPMASLSIKTSRTSDDVNEAIRILEICVRDSKCIDLESLCIVSGLKVWCIRVNMHVLSDDGNYIECASIACIAALAHFKRPNVTVVGTDITVHSIEDHNPIPLTLHHMPVIVNLCIFGEKPVIIVDPLEMEERIALGKIIVGVNAHQEICSWHHCGEMMLSTETVVQCMNMSVKRAQATTQIIRSSLDKDKYKRSTNQPTGFVSLMHTSTILGARHFLPQPEVLQEVSQAGDEIEAQMNEEELENSQLEISPTESPIKGKVRKFLRKKGEVALFEGGKSSWKMKGDEDIESEDDDEENYVKKEYEDDGYAKVKEEGEIEDERKPNALKSEKISEVVTLSDSDGSEEENKHFLKSHQIDIKDEKAAAVRGWYSKNPF